MNLQNAVGIPKTHDSIIPYLIMESVSDISYCYGDEYDEYIERRFDPAIIDVKEPEPVVPEEVNERFYTFTDESVYQSITSKIRAAGWVGCGHSLVTQKCS